MDNLAMFTNGLYTSLLDKFGSRFKGYSIVNDGLGYIEGTVDLKKLKLKCENNQILFRVSNDRGPLSDELYNLISEYVGNTEIENYQNRISIVLNRIDTNITLSHSINEMNKKAK